MVGVSKKISNVLLILSVGLAFPVFEQDKLLAEIESYEQHLANHDALISLIAAERDRMSRELRI